MRRRRKEVVAGLYVFDKVSYAYERHSAEDKEKKRHSKPENPKIIIFFFTFYKLSDAIPLAPLVPDKHHSIGDSPHIFGDCPLCFRDCPQCFELAAGGDSPPISGAQLHVFRPKLPFSANYGKSSFWRCAQFVGRQAVDRPYAKLLVLYYGRNLARKEVTAHSDDNQRR